VAESTGTGDFERASKLLSTGCFMVLMFSIVTLVPIALFSAKLPVVLNVPQEFAGIFNESVKVLAITMIFCNVGSVYSAIIMGAHRIDLVKTIDSICTLGQSLIAFVLLILGFGLFGMVISLAATEFIRASIFFVLSSRILPRVRVAPNHFSYSYLKEILRFAGSYQVYSFLEIAYAGILPFLMLKFFNPEITGIYAVSRRFVNLAALISESLLLPFLSGAAWTYGKGKLAEFSTLISKAMKFTMTVLVPALMFLSLFGRKILLGFTGHDSHLFTSGLILLAGGVICSSLARVYCATYRATGGSSLDLLWTIMRIAFLTFGFVLGTKLWHYNGGLLAYFMVELIGLKFMHLSIQKILSNVNFYPIRLDFAKITFISLGICAICSIVLLAPLPVPDNERFIAFVRAGAGAVAFLLMGGYTLWRSSYLSSDEKESLKAIFHTLNLKQFANAKQ